MQNLIAVSNKVVELNNQLATVTAQRDRLADQLDDAVAEATNAVNDIIGMKWQRDRLAEALRECLNRLEHHTEFGALVQADMSAMHSSREALQSLTPNTKP